MTTCLLNIDLVNDCLRHLPSPAVDRLIANTNMLAGAFRRAGLPIIWIRQEFSLDLSDAFLEMRQRGIRTAVAGTNGALMDKRLAVQAEDYVIVKKRYSAFFGTELDKHLGFLGVSELVLTGINTHACIRTTAIDAYQRDLSVILATDCLGSYDEKHAVMSIRYMDGKIAKTMTNEALASKLSG